MDDDKTEEKKTRDPLRFDLEREDFVETFFRKGAEFTSKLLSDLQALQKESDRLRHENAELRHHLASEEAIRELLQKIEALEHEKRRLADHVEVTSKTNENYAARYAEVEKELDTMANLYVALSQLHSKFEPKEMLGVIEQLLAQFVGAGSFIIYLRSGTRDDPVLTPVHAYHCDEVGGVIRWSEGPVGEAAATQMHFVADAGSRSADTPLACIPMVLGNDTVGVISIKNLFEQKSQFEDIDFELFKLLAVHSASAIVAAGLMTQAESVGISLKRYERL